MSHARELETRALDANPWLVVTLRGDVHAVSIDVENRIDAGRHGISPTLLESAPRVAPGALEALLHGGARFAMLRGPDRRPHPACARGLLARIDARVRAGGMRALVGPWNEAHGPLDEALRCADGLLARGNTELAVRVQLCEDIDDVRLAAPMPSASQTTFSGALRADRPALEALCGGIVELAHDPDDALRLRVKQPRVAPHVLLAAVLAAGTVPRRDTAAGAAPPDGTIAELLAEAIRAQLQAGAP